MRSLSLPKKDMEGLAFAFRSKPPEGRDKAGSARSRGARRRAGRARRPRHSLRPGGNVRRPRERVACRRGHARRSALDRRAWLPSRAARERGWRWGAASGSLAPCAAAPLLALALCAAGPAAAQDAMTAAEFEAHVEGRTMTYATAGGAPYGAEEYRPGRRVRWSVLDGECLEGVWYERGEDICLSLRRARRREVLALHHDPAGARRAVDAFRSLGHARSGT